MTKEITKAHIIQEIQDKLGLREFEAANFLFDETVLPVYNIERHLTKPTRQGKSLSITSADSFQFFTVPEDEKWRLHRYAVIFVSGAYTVAGVFIGRPDAVHYVYIDLTAAQNTSYINDLPKDALLDSGDGIFVNIDGYTSTGGMTLIIDTTVEKIR